MVEEASGVYSTVLTEPTSLVQRRHSRHKAQVTFEFRTGFNPHRTVLNYLQDCPDELDRDAAKPPSIESADSLIYQRANGRSSSSVDSEQGSKDICISRRNSPKDVHRSKFAGLGQ